MDVKLMDKNRIVAIAGFLVFAGLALALISRAGITPGFLDEILLKSIEMSLSQKMPFDIATILGGIVLLSLSFAFVSSYALIREKTDPAILGASAVLFALMVAAGGTGITSIALGFGIFLSPLVIQYVATDDKKAYKEFRAGRMTSHAVGTAMLVISLLVAVSVFYTTSADASYADKAIDSVVDATMVLAVGGQSQQVSQIPGGEEIFREKMKEVKEQLKSMPMFAAFKAYFPHMSALTVFSAIQLAGMIVIAPLSGLFGWILYRFMAKGEAGKQG